jgi:hypothetical protein
MKKKTILSVLALVIISIVLIATAGYVFDVIPAITSPSSKTTPPTTPAYSPTIPSGSNPLAPPQTTVIFDFDRGTPVISEGQNTPFDQMSGGVNAHFGSPSDPATFSIQSYDTTFYTLSDFSGKYLFDNKNSRDILYIGFSQPLSDITLTFATIEYHGVGNVDTPSQMKITAYMDSADSVAVGSAVARGNFSNNLYPQGTLLFNSQNQPFNLVKIEMLPQEPGGMNYLIDNIVVTTAP